MDDVLGLLGNEIKEVILGFVPKDSGGFDVKKYYEDDCAFFIKGEKLNIIEQEKLRIPSLSHA